MVPQDLFMRRIVVFFVLICKQQQKAGFVVQHDLRFLLLNDENLNIQTTELTFL